MLLSKSISYLTRKLRGFAFVIFRPTYWGVDFINPGKIIFGKNSRISPGGRLYLFHDSSHLIVGDNVWGGRNVDLHVPESSSMNICHHVSLQDNCKIVGDVEVGAYSIFAPNVFMSSSSHQFKFSPPEIIKKQDLVEKVKPRKIVIGEDVWLGINVVISPGVSIGRGAVVGANSVVTKDIPPYTIWAGIPAKQIDVRLAFEPKLEINSALKSDLPYFYKGFDHWNISDKGLLLIESLGNVKIKIPENSRLKLECCVAASLAQTISLKLGSSDHSFSLDPGKRTIELTSTEEKDSFEISNVSEGSLYLKSAVVSEGPL